MSIKYRLEPLKVQNNSRAYYPIVVLAGRINYDALLADMATANTSFSYADIVGVTHLLMERLVYFVTHGFSVTLPLFTVRPVGQGKITPDTTSAALWVDAKFQAGKMLRSAMSKVSLERDSSGATDQPEIIFLLDDASHTWNVIVTIGGTAMVLGERLKFDPDDPQQGVFFVEEDSGVAMRAQSMGSVRASRVVLHLPLTLTLGKTYIVEIRAVFENDASGRLRVGRLPFAISATEK